jgi:hypothetical protein
LIVEIELGEGAVAKAVLRDAIKALADIGLFRRLPNASSTEEIRLVIPIEIKY